MDNMDSNDSDIQADASLQALARRLSERWQQEFTGLRAALNQQISSIETRISEGDYKPALEAAVKNVSRLAAESAQRARQQAEAAAALAAATVEAEWQARLDSERATNAVLLKALDETKRQLESAQDSVAIAKAAQAAIETQYRKALKESRQVAAALGEAQAQAPDAKARLKTAHREPESSTVGSPAAQQQVQAPPADRGRPQPRLKDVSAPRAAAEGPPERLVVASQRLTDAPPPVGGPIHEVVTLAGDLRPKAPAITPTKPLQFSGPARDAKRVLIRRDISATIDGIPGELVDLSVGGAQTLLTQAISPNQLVRLKLPAADGPVMCKGRIVWTVVEQRTTSILVYRTGVKFTDVDTVAVEKFMNDFCERPTIGQSRRSSGVA